MLRLRPLLVLLQSYKMAPLICRTDLKSTAQFNLAGPLLLPRDVGDHQHHDVELQTVTDVDRRHEMPHVRRVERAPEQPDSADGGARTRHDVPLYEGWVKIRSADP